MPSLANVALTLTEWLPDNIEGDFIGADRGALILAQRNIPMRLAIGDFDSVSEEEFRLIRQYAGEVIRLNPVKDDSDSEAALNELLKRGYSRITFLDPLGGRADQAYVNLMLAWKHPGILTLLDEQNRIMALKEGRYELQKEDYSYISFFTFTDAMITLEGMKYPLSRQTIAMDDLYTLSNEITCKKGILTIHQGKAIVMQTKDKSTAR